MRYIRQINLKGFGLEAQNKLKNAKVLVVGLGGLGHPVVQYLCGAGVGHLGLVDFDTVSLSNLHRQVIFGTSDIGKTKIETVILKLKEQNPEVKIEAFNFDLNSQNAESIIKKFDLVIDCTDNFAVRYLINDVCFLLRKPLIFGAIFQYEGQVAIFNIPDKNGISTQYRDLFPEPPQQVPTCNEAGVLGVLPGIIGLFQASEAIKIISQIGSILQNKLYTYNILDHSSFKLNINKNPKADFFTPKSLEEIKQTNYILLCNKTTIPELNINELKEELLDSETLLIDVREWNESELQEFENLKIPLSELKKEIPEIKQNNLILICQSGKRSLQAAELLSYFYQNSKEIKHIKGGINALNSNQL